MTLAQFFKSKENDCEVLQNEELNEFTYEKIVIKMGKAVGMFYGMIDTKIYPHFVKHVYYIDEHGYEVFEEQKSECLDGVWVNYGKPMLKRGRKIF